MCAVIAAHGVELGLGLVGIGRPWGAGERGVPTASQVAELLEIAVSSSVSFFDTAPAYGTSEARLGSFLTTLAPERRQSLRISSKCGEEFDLATQSSHVDHRVEALERSVERSLSRLGPLALMQVHKADEAVLCDDRVWQMLARYRGRGVAQLGVSVKDERSAQRALDHSEVDAIQLSFHLGYRKFEALIGSARRLGKQILVNRPFASGQLIETHPTSRTDALSQAFGFLHTHLGEGAIVLMGTKNPEHLVQNIALFLKTAQEERS